MPPETSISRDLARRLIDREPVRQDATDPAVAAAQAACEEVFQNLSRWVGHFGSAALFTRALFTAQREHPVLVNVRIRADTATRPGEVGDVLHTGESGETAAALEALLVELLELLSRFVGADVVVRILYLGVLEGRNTTLDLERISKRTPS